MIRNATHADIPAIVDMSRKFYATTSYAGWAAFCPDAVENLARMLIDTGVMLVYGAERPVGMVGLVVAPFMFNASQTAAYEVVWWVEPEAQNQGAGKALLAAIEPACRELGCDAIQMMTLHDSPPQAVAIYERFGYRHSESSYTKVI